jgi:hypothetical protein
MNDLSDYELDRNLGESLPPPPTPSRSTGLWVAVAVLMAAAGAAAFIAFAWRPSPEPPRRFTTEHAAATQASSSPLGGKGEPAAVPALDESDTFVRTLVRKLSGSPTVWAWLSTDGLIRNFTVVVANIAEGATPAKHLRVLRPLSAFRILERDGKLYASPRSYDRYAAIADAVGSVDSAAAARLYATLKPRIEEAYRDLGYPDQSFDRILERAIVTLLGTPVADGLVRLKPRGIGYEYVDERLEDMTDAQKQLLRMGPRNVRIIEEKLRGIALALGIPSSHLPAA